jgi:hypothetical protein
MHEILPHDAIVPKGVMLQRWVWITDYDRRRQAGQQRYNYAYFQNNLDR